MKDIVMYNKLLIIIFALHNKILPILKNTVMFDSYNGQYNDNPKYISECLHNINPFITIVWTTSKHGHEMAPSYCKIVIYKSLKYYYYLNCAAVVVDNYIGIRNFGFKNFYSKMLYKIVNNNNQLCISTWHGTPLKKIGKDIIQHSVNNYYTCTDYCIVGCKYTADILENAYLLNNKILFCGTPRNDILVKSITNVTKIKQKLRLPLNKKIILYAPTFRETINLSGIDQIKILKFDEIINKLKLVFGGDFIFVFRVHHGMLEKIDINKILKDYKGIVYNGNIGDDMAEYLKCTDVLITDYSGSLFDFALTKKPCFLFAPDRNHYEYIERGFYMNYDTLPFPIANTYTELINCINNFSEKDYIDNIDNFLNRIGNIEDGYASERVASIVNHFLITGSKQFI